ncbi:CerR family C-terminal domain-containing protein [Desulfovibrio gilichinskyi]|uniref:Transcriptional regulator, TetR family n=1 Tax=Desulfovibrio gilichinskyi TaxID=1519643 RepID=A0A1X7EX65_9BACT|nr:CerR family C-terminal domain-containing protein [Desulfovibrio gilichinskyi]SMF41387.1 transcriptional regulator, TetR family [Desulfovibrio gilichinskyi]
MTNISKKQNSKMGRGEDTRQRLIQVGARLFALNGFRGVSMRILAVEAQINLATVGYHFGGKLGLYEAVLRHTVNRTHEVFPAIDEVRSQIAMLELGQLKKSDLITWFFTKFIRGIVGDTENVWIALIIIRELAAPSELYYLLEEGLFSPSFLSLTELLTAVMGSDVSEEERIIVGNALMGMALHFVNRKAFVFRIGWDEYTPENIEKIIEILCRRAVAFVCCGE